MLDTAQRGMSRLDICSGDAGDNQPCASRQS
jgi:hypothetical protein